MAFASDGYYVIIPAYVEHPPFSITFRLNALRTFAEIIVNIYGYAFML
jgi:hypothetical protein